MMKRILILISICTVGVACKKDSRTINVDLGYNYFPLQEGAWRVYDVDSIFHNDFTLTVDTFQYQIKEVFDTTFIDLEGRLSFELKRYKRLNLDSVWRLADVWYSTYTNNGVEQVEENVRLMKLIFPTREGETWDGNVLNSAEANEYEYLTVDESSVINLMAYDSTLTVLQLDEINLIEKHYAEEKYARNIGMIYKEFVTLDYQSEGGLEFYMYLNSYGVKK